MKTYSTERKGVVLRQTMPPENKPMSAKEVHRSENALAEEVALPILRKTQAIWWIKRGRLISAQIAVQMSR